MAVSKTQALILLGGAVGFGLAILFHQRGIFPFGGAISSSPTTSSTFPVYLHGYYPGLQEYRAPPLIWNPPNLQYQSYFLAGYLTAILNGERQLKKRDGRRETPAG
jgi:hypothetical protein